VIRDEERRSLREMGKTADLGIEPAPEDRLEEVDDPPDPARIAIRLRHGPHDGPLGPRDEREQVKALDSRGRLPYHRAVSAALATLTDEVTGDFNRRFVVRLADGASVEAVLYRGDTLCISTQVGCAVGCPFCASGARGLVRPLRLEELKAQVHEVRKVAPSLRRLTLSGVGEPLHCPDAVELVRWSRSEGLPASVTTSGGPLPKLTEWMLDVPHNGITISVHAGTEEARRRLVPKGPSLGALFATLEELVPRLSSRRRKKLALAYLMIDGENEGDDELDAFTARVLPLGASVHLYAYNPVPTSSARPVTRARYEEAYERLTARGLRVRMSSKARVEANGGCGTLIAARGAYRGVHDSSR
jgi:23S rRNA (adenine2503-C2)-methyltransferase